MDFVRRMMGFVLKMMDFLLGTQFADRVQAATADHLGLVASRWGNREKVRLFLNWNDELCTKNDEFCTKSDECCIKNDEFGKNLFFSRDMEAFTAAGFATEHWLPPG